MLTQNNCMHYIKVYLPIVAEFTSRGGIRPKKLIWNINEEFEIERVKAIERAPCKSGGILPIRYTVIIDGQEKYLYFEKDKERWFVEKLVE